MINYKIFKKGGSYALFEALLQNQESKRIRQNH